MKRSTLLSLIICILVLAGIAVRNGAFLTLAIPVMVYLAAGLLFEPSSPRLTATRRFSTNRATAGQPVTVTVIVTNNGPQLNEVLIEDTLPSFLQLINGQTSLLSTLNPGQSVTLEYTIFGKRGLQRFAKIQITSRETLGLFAKTAAISAPGQFLVLPDVVPIRKVAIRPPRTGIYSGLIPARQGGPGVEFFGVREYHPGDPMRWINERASARFHQRLFVNEFEQERVVDVGLVLDARRQSDTNSAEGTLFEYSVQAAAALADTFLNGGNRVGLFIYGRSLDWTFPGYGKMQKERILQSLARAKQGGGTVFGKLEHLPTQLFPVRSQLVFISPLLKEDTGILIKLRARGYRLMVISPDPVLFEQNSLPSGNTVGLATRLARLERNLILDQLKKAEIQVVDWPVNIPFHQIAHIALSRVPFQRTGVV